MKIFECCLVTTGRWNKIHWSGTGELYQPLVVVPPVLISPDDKVKISLSTTIISRENCNWREEKRFEAPKWCRPNQPGWGKGAAHLPPSCLLKRIKTIFYSINAGRDNEYSFAADANNGRKDLLHVGMREIKYDHILILALSAATYQPEDWPEDFNKKINITGAGDKKCPEARSKWDMK